MAPPWRGLGKEQLVFASTYRVPRAVPFSLLTHRAILRRRYCDYRMLQMKTWSLESKLEPGSRLQSPQSFPWCINGMKIWTKGCSLTDQRAKPLAITGRKQLNKSFFFFSYLGPYRYTTTHYFQKYIKRSCTKVFLVPRRLISRSFSPCVHTNT